MSKPIAIQKEKKSNMNINIKRSKNCAADVSVPGKHVRQGLEGQGKRVIG